MNLLQYILNDRGEPEPCHDLMAWGQFMGDIAKRGVAKTELDGGVRVSTVFLGIDHQFSDDGPPILFETMIFGGPHDQYQERYTTRAEAEAGHAVAVELAKETTHA